MSNMVNLCHALPSITLQSLHAYISHLEGEKKFVDWYLILSHGSNFSKISPFFCLHLLSIICPVSGKVYDLISFFIPCSMFLAFIHPLISPPSFLIWHLSSFQNLELVDLYATTVFFQCFRHCSQLLSCLIIQAITFKCIPISYLLIFVSRDWEKMRWGVPSVIRSIYNKIGIHDFVSQPI